MPSINFQSLGAKADYLCLPARYRINLNTEKKYNLETLFGLKKFYSVHPFRADTAVEVYSSMQTIWGRKKNVK